MTKQEKIKEAYREWWPAVKEYVDENGWFFTDNFDKINLTYEDVSATVDFIHDHSTYEMIPKEIQGIRDNNGWIKIETEADFPKKNCDVWTVLENGKIYMQRYIIEYVDFSVHPKKYITHYQIVSVPKSPIY